MILNIPLRLIQFDSFGYQIFIDAKINSKPINMLVDTGASNTAFDLTRIKRHVRIKKEELVLNENSGIGLGTNSMDCHYSKVKVFCISELKLENFQMVLIDMKHINQMFRKIAVPEIDGVIGGDLLVKYKGVIDYKKKLLKLTI